LRHAAAWLALLLASTAQSAALFDEDAVLEVSLSGPLSTLIENKEAKEELPFVLGVDGKNIDVRISARGKSRIVVCDFPPLRVEFTDESAASTVFAGQHRLKLVTHCKSSEHTENNVLDEFSAYRIFNVISEAGYRVRLLRITYVDTEGRNRHLDDAHYGFLIESDDELAARLGAQTAHLAGVAYARLEPRQTSLVYVFQYLVGNTDWSLVLADGADTCCHNIDVFDAGGDLIIVPYDFDLSGLVDASYARPARETGINKVTQRRYRGYCKTDETSLRDSLHRIVTLREQILAVAGNVPALSDGYAEKRIRFLGRFFDGAADESALLDKFNRACLGRR
jgi:hypothetical protein